jgi:hypothetical protein
MAEVLRPRLCPPQWTRRESGATQTHSLCRYVAGAPYRCCSSVPGAVSAMASASASAMGSSGGVCTSRAARRMSPSSSCCAGGGDGGGWDGRQLLAHDTGGVPGVPGWACGHATPSQPRHFPLAREGPSCVQSLTHLRAPQRSAPMAAHALVVPHAHVHPRRVHASHCAVPVPSPPCVRCHE